MFGDPGAVAEADEQRDRGVHHPHGLGHHAGAAPEPRQPVPLAGMVPLDAVRLLLADVEAPLRDRLGVGRPVVGTVEADAPTLDALEWACEGGGDTNPAPPANPSA